MPYLVGAAVCTLTTGAAGCTLTVGIAGSGLVGAAGCTLMVRAAGRGLVGAGGVLRPSPLRFALRAHGTRSQFGLRPHHN